MITVGAILHLELPVAVVDVAGIAAQHFEPFGRGIHHLVDDRACRAQMFCQRRPLGGQRAEEEAAIALEPPQTGQVM
jgi:hypothetical protein